MSQTVKVSPAVFLGAMFAFFLLSVFYSLPLTFFLMLFLGNLGLHESFLACLPGAMVLATFKTKTTSSK